MVLRNTVVLEFAKTMLPDASTPPTRATEHMGTQRDINKQLIHTTHRLHSQYRFGAISRVSAIATPALHAQAARNRAAHTIARTPARAHRGCPKSPPGSHLAARNPHIRGLAGGRQQGASSARHVCRPSSVPCMLAAPGMRRPRWAFMPASRSPPGVIRGMRAGVHLESTLPTILPASPFLAIFSGHFCPGFVSRVALLAR